MLTYISNSTRVLCPRVHFKMLVFDGKNETLKLAS